MAGEFYGTAHRPIKDGAGLILQLGSRVARKFVHRFAVVGSFVVRFVVGFDLVVCLTVVWSGDPLRVAGMCGRSIGELGLLAVVVAGAPSGLRDVHFSYFSRACNLERDATSEQALTA